MATASLASDDATAAVVTLKESLQAQPEHAPTRLLLARALLEADDPMGAEVELRKAQSLNAAPDEFVPLLARSLLAQQQPARVEFVEGMAGLQSADARADFLTTAALARAMMGQPEESAQLLTRALEAKPDDARAMLARARMLAVDKRFDAALQAVEAVLAKDPRHADALLLKGDVLALTSPSGADAAIELARQAVQARPRHLAAHGALVTRLLARQDLKGAEEAVKALRSARPGHPLADYHQARLALARGDGQTARELTARLVTAGPNYPPYIELAGLAALRAQEPLAAEKHFARLAQLAPESEAARLLLASVQLKGADPDKALATLDSLLKRAAPPAAAMALAGRAYLLMGQSQQAEQWLTRAAAKRDGGVGDRAALGLARIQQDKAAGLADLEAAAAADPGFTSDLALLTGLIAKRDFPAALKAVDRLGQKPAGAPMVSHVRGQVLLAKGDRAAARQSFQAAAKADPSYFPAVSAEADMDLAERKPDQARQRLEAFLKAQPQHVAALLALAAIDLADGLVDNSRQRLQQALEVQPPDARPRMALVRFHLSRGEPDQAVAAAQSGLSSLPDHAGLLELLGQSQLRAGNVQQAVNTLAKLVSQSPRQVAPLLMLGDAQVAAGAMAAAVDTAHRARALAPGSADVQQRTTRIEAAAGRHDDALRHARELQKSQPQSALGFVLEGDVEADRKHWAVAAAAYRAGLRRQPVTTLAQRLHLALRSAGDKQQAESFETEWLRAHASDATFTFHLATVALADGRLDVAESALRRTLALAPDSAAAHNNLAVVLMRSKKPGAVDAAERAVALVPSQGAFLDTLADALSAAGRTSQALEQQKRAVALAPSAPEFRLRLARLYANAGYKAAAEEQLDLLDKLGSRFARQSEVRELRSRL